MELYLYYTISYQRVVRDVFAVCVPLLNKISFLKMVVAAGPSGRAV
jgi:hypothetical protein